MPERLPRQPPSGTRPARGAHPVVVALGCVAGIAVGVAGAGVTLLMMAGLANFIGPVTRQKPLGGEAPLTFALLGLLPIGAACLWMRRLLRPRPPWAISMGVAYIATIVWFVGSAL